MNVEEVTRLERLDRKDGDDCPKCHRITYLDDDGYRRCGRYWHGFPNTCGWKSPRPISDDS